MQQLKTLEALGATFNFIDIWLQLLRKNYCARSESYINAMKEMFMQIPQNIEIALTSKEKIQKLLIDIGGRWYKAKSARGLPPLKRTKLSKKSQESQDYIQKKLYKSNRWWNDWIFHLNWNKIEWVDPKSIPKIVKPCSVSSKSSVLVKMIEKHIFWSF